MCAKPGNFRHWIRVYPRVCGGTPFKPCVFSPTTVNRSIPACAGEPFLRWPQSAHSREVYPRVCGGIRRQLWHGQVYPRVCGGKAAEPYVIRWAQGLSPRVRGNPNCTFTLSIASRGRVYPRVCGGTNGTAFHPTRIYRGVYPRVCGGTHEASHGIAWIRKVYPRVCGGTGLSGGDHG